MLNIIINLWSVCDSWCFNDLLSENNIDWLLNFLSLIRYLRFDGYPGTSFVSIINCLILIVLFYNFNGLDFKYLHLTVSNSNISGTGDFQPFLLLMLSLMFSIRKWWFLEDSFLSDRLVIWFPIDRLLRLRFYLL